ncbi:type I-E CRISPR-associated protein Cse2/CasB [Actinacidiphila sp. bgisy167]|uniref:type I-E CRISPR-associated protein Cse2/CasB n=1 Tax=Actinacidiphila sp. bgisy167 TaxID=3413797 RepID=UPI003D74FF7F
MSTPPSSEARFPTSPGPVGTLAGREIGRLQHGYLDDRPDAVAVLARLRRAAGKDAASVPDLWGLIDLDPLFNVASLRHDAAAGAVDTALALWALHQQSRPTGMHRPGGDELGSAVRRLMRGTTVDEPVRKRFVSAGRAPTLGVLATRLRDLTVLLRDRGFALDYALLADQLYHWQQPGGPENVRRSWGRSFHAAYRTAPTDPAAAAAIDTKDAS